MPKTVEVDVSPELLALVKPGRKLRFDFGEGNPNSRLVHVCAIVDFWNVVVKEWYPRKQNWHYSIEGMYYLQLCWEDGHLTDAGESEHPLQVIGPEVENA